MARQIFITGTDTGVGKTFVTTHLIQDLLKKNISALALKPIAAGIDSDGINEDVSQLQQAQNLAAPDSINLYSFKMPAAPEIAAAAENKSIDSQKLIDWCQQQAATSDICLIEGVGGLMVPLTKDYLVSDWLTDLSDAEVMLVIGIRLGCINHALLTLEKLKAMGRSPAWIILNEGISDNHEPKMIEALISHAPKESIMIQPVKKGGFSKESLNNLSDLIHMRD